MLHRKLVVTDSVAEVQAGGKGEVGFEDEAELREQSLATGRGVSEKKAGLGGVVDL